MTWGIHLDFLPQPLGYFDSSEYNSGDYLDNNNQDHNNTYIDYNYEIRSNLLSTDSFIELFNFKLYSELYLVGWRYSTGKIFISYNLFKYSGYCCTP